MAGIEVTSVGAVCFGVTVGYVTYRTLVRTTEKTAIGDLATVIGAIGGAAVTAIFDPKRTDLFAWYSIGLLVGLVLFFFGFLWLNGKQELAKVMSAPDRGLDREPAGGPRV